MSGQMIGVEIYALSDMNTSLRKLLVGASESLAQAQRDLDSERQRLRDIEDQCQKVVEQYTKAVQHCQAAYQSCRSRRDQDGNVPSCTAEQRALENAQEELQEARKKLDHVQKHRKGFEDRADAYRSKLESSQDSLDSSITSARQNLEKHIEAGLNYLKHNPGQIGNIPGAGNHGKLYQKARKEWFQRATAGENPEIGKGLRGWMKQEVRRGGYYRTVPYYDTGHRVASIDIPENFHWEHRSDNRAKPHRAKRWKAPFTCR